MKLLLPFLCLCFFNLAFNSNLTGQIPCSNNTDCIFSTNITFDDSIKTVCINGCNVDMPVATFCGGSMVASAWYKFNTGNNNAIIIDISSGDLTTPIVALVENCNTVLSCESKIGNLAMNSEYYIVVADQNNLQGDFSLCLTLTKDSSLCIRDESLVVTNTSLGSPLDGPYFPGETLTFTYSNSFFAGGGCQWLHSFIPILSECWGDEIPHLVTPPFGSQLVWAPQGSMTWKPTINEPASAIGINDDGQLCLIGSAGCHDFVGGGQCGMTGTAMPAGWASIITSGTCGGSNDPNLAWGISQGCGTLKENSLSFTIKIPEDAKDCIAENGLTIGLAAFTDGATGGYNNASCNGNGFDLINIFTNDCVAPTIFVMNDTICSGSFFNPEITLVPDTSLIMWTVDNIPGIKGTYNGTGKIITQQLENETDEEITVQYKIRALGGDGCVGPTQTLKVLVYPAVKSNIGDQFICSDSLIEIASVPSGGAGGPYDHIWSTGESHSTTILFKTNADTSFQVYITDHLGCTNIDTVHVMTLSSLPIVKPSDTALIGELIIFNSELIDYSVNDFDNAEDYTWTLDGVVISHGQNISYSFEHITNGIHTLCVIANNCSLKPESICWNIVVNTLAKHDAEKQIFKLYPNPNDGVFNLELPSFMDGKMELYDLNGRKVFSQRLNKSNSIQQLEIKNLPPGLYIVLVKNIDGKMIGSNKLIIHTD